MGGIGGCYVNERSQAWKDTYTIYLSRVESKSIDLEIESPVVVTRGGGG